MPIEPPPNSWVLPSPSRPLVGEVVGVGADLAPGTLLAAYRAGLFPMRLEGLEGPLAWWSPNPRGVLPLDGLRVSRSLRQSCRRYEVRIDTAFDAVVAGCAGSPVTPGGVAQERDGAWIDADIRAAYGELHRLGWAHSVETWSGDGELIGGLYGVATGGLFAGESMFHRARDASKVALVALVGVLRDGVPGRVLDVQWATPHLEGLGVVEVSRRRYLKMLGAALALPVPAGLQQPGPLTT